jgi:hypothetical protein
LLALPPVVLGQAAAGDEPGLEIAVGVGVTVVLGRADAVGVGDDVGVVAGLADREAVGFGVAVGGEATSGCGPHALTITMPRARASAP